MSLVECIAWKNRPLAYIVRGEMSPEKTTFVTPPELSLQIGFVVTAKDSEIPAHLHRPVERRVVGTPEVLMVKRGRCSVDIFSEERDLVATHELRTGDVILMIEGGHGFRMLEATTFLEVKQGPYGGLDEKERF